MRVAVVGTGLVGASVGLAARDRLGAEVAGFDADPGALAAAAALGAVEAAGSIAGAAAGAGLVFVCTPVSAIAAAAAEALRSCEGTVTDVGSAKSAVVRDVARAAPAEVARFVGGHPMAGSERSGPGAASAGLFEGAPWALTPVEGTDPGALAAVEDAVRLMGARPVRLTPERHDRAVAVVSHLPQLLSFALALAAGERGAHEQEVAALAARGFREMTRLAGSDPALWTDILLANREEVAAALDELLARLRTLGALVSSADAAGLTEALSEARAVRPPAAGP